MEAPTMAKLVSSLHHCNTNHHVMTMCLLILLGYLQGFIRIWEPDRFVEGDKFHSKSKSLVVLQALSEINLFTFH